MVNFMNVFENLESIPLAILIKPLIKQIQVSENDIYLLNISDFNFFLFLAKNEKLDATLAIQLLDLLAKIYLNNIVFAQLIAQAMVIIINRFIDEPGLQEFAGKFAKISLAIYYASEKKKKPKGKVQAMYNSKQTAMGPQLSLQEMEMEVISSQKRALIVEILIQIVNQKCPEINDKLQTMVAYTNIQIKQFSKQYNKGLLQILSQFGNLQDQLTKYEKEYNEKCIQPKQNKLEESKDQQPNSDQENLNSSVDKNLLDQYGIGLKKKNYLTKLSKAEKSKLSFLKNPRVSPQVLKEIKETNRRNYLLRKEQEEQEQRAKQQQAEAQKIRLREQLQKRSIEQGIGTLNQKDISTENNLFEFGSRQAQLEKEKKHGLIEFEPIDLELEEERDKKLVEIFFNKNRKIFHHLFVKYSNSQLRLKQESFEKYSKTSQVITISELYKIFKEHDFQQLLTSLQLQSIMRETQVKIFRNKADCHELTFDQYLNVIMQVSQFSYPHLQHMPVAFSLNQLLQHFKQAEEKRKINTLLYDDPDAAVFGDSDVIKEFNKILKENPDYQLPEGFTKNYSKNIDFNYSLPQEFMAKLDGKYNMIYSLINDIFIETFQINLIEPLSKEITEVKVRPTGKAALLPKGYNPENYFKPLQKKINEKEKERQYDIEYWMKQAKILRQPQNKQEKHRVLEINHYRPLSFTLKMEVAKASAKDKFTAQEVAQVMEDLLGAVEQQRDFIVAPGEVVNKKKKNEALKQKEEQEKIAQQQDEKKQKERQQYVDKLKNEYAKLTEEKKKEEDLRRKNMREQRLRQKQEKKKYLEQLKAEQEQKEKLKEIEEEKRRQDMRKKEETNRILRREQMLKKKEEFDEFNQKKIEQYSKANQAKLEKLKEEQQSRLTVEKELEKIKEYKQKILPKHIIQNKVLKQDYLEREKKIEQIFENEGIQNFFRKYEHHFVDLFDVLISETYTPINFRGRRDTVPIATLYEFVNLFNITPTCVKLLDISNIYHTLAKEKPYIDNIEIGLDFEEFLNFILRVTIKGIKVFNKIALKLSKYQIDKYETTEDFEKLQQSALDITQVPQQENEEQFDQSVAQVEEILKQQPERRIENNKEDYKFEASLIDQVNQYTLYAFLYYCGFSFDPRDNNSVLRRFKQKKEIPHMPNRKKKLQMLATLEKNVLENLISPTKDLSPQMQKQLNNASKVNQSKILPDDVKDQNNDEKSNDKQ